jgi:predicted amidohydrolase
MKIGYIQNAPVFGEVEENFEAVEKMVQGVEADLLVLPELFATGYTFISRKEAEATAETWEGPTASFLQGLARKTGAVISAGFVEADNGKISLTIDATQMSANKFTLDQNFPNPFNPVTSISYALKNDSDVKLDIYNLSGQLILTLVNEHQEKGLKVIEWNGGNKFGEKVYAGIYFYQLQAGDFTQTRKMVLLK